MSSEYKAKLSSLEQACQDGQEYLSAVTAEGSSGDVTPIVGSKALMKPFWISQCDSLVFYRARKTGCLISRTHGFGFMIHRCGLEGRGEGGEVERGDNPGARQHKLVWDITSFIRDASLIEGLA